MIKPAHKVKKELRAELMILLTIKSPLTVSTTRGQPTKSLYVRAGHQQFFTTGGGATSGVPPDRSFLPSICSQL